MDANSLIEGLSVLSADQKKLSDAAASLAETGAGFGNTKCRSGRRPRLFYHGPDDFRSGLLRRLLRRVARDSRLAFAMMAVTNAVSSVIIVGALVAASLQGMGLSTWLGLGAVVLASINIFGGFIVTQRMLQMYKKKGK
jgi:hypothetical protein